MYNAVGLGGCKVVRDVADHIAGGGGLGVVTESTNYASKLWDTSFLAGSECESHIISEVST